MSKSTLSPRIKEILLDMVEDSLKPRLESLPFNDPDEVREALMFLAEEIESLDYDEIFSNVDNGRII